MAEVSINQGDIYLVPFPNSDLATPKYHRPAIVISGNDVNETADLILVAITSRIRKDKFSYDLVGKTASPMPKESEIRCHKLFTMEKSLIENKITSLKSKPLHELLNKVKSFISKNKN